MKIYQKPVAVVALVNSKSGGGLGEKVIKTLKRLNVHVFDLIAYAKNTKGVGQQIVDFVSKCRDKGFEVRAIVAGGDGTVTWAFGIFNSLKLEIPLAILPLGTANEVAGVTGWSNSPPKIALETLGQFVGCVQHGRIFSLDVWNCKYEDNPAKMVKEKPAPERRPQYMAAFFSVGFDAKIVYNFEKSRQSWTETTTMKNKAEYLKFGAKEMFEQFPKLGNVGVKVLLDNKDIKYPEARCFCITNINSIADGMDIFGVDPKFRLPLLNDGTFEACTVRSVHHHNRIRVGVSSSNRLGQFSKMRMELPDYMFVEVDGEAWEQPPGAIEITYAGPRLMVLGPDLNTKTKNGISFLNYTAVRTLDYSNSLVALKQRAFKLAGEDKPDEKQDVEKIPDAKKPKPDANNPAPLVEQTEKSEVMKEQENKPVV